MQLYKQKIQFSTAGIVLGNYIIFLTPVNYKFIISLLELDWLLNNKTGLTLPKNTQVDFGT